MPHRLTIGLTGGFASGKTTVLKIFHALGIDTFSADIAAHALMANNGIAYPEIALHFGSSILNANQMIDRSKLRSIIFDNPEEKKWLEEYLHPLIRQNLFEQIEKATSPYTLVEIPLLAESKAPIEWIDKILVVDADKEMQQLRATSRSKLSKVESHKIINQQATRQERNRIADDILFNQGDLVQLELAVKQLHNKYLELSELYTR